MAEYLTNSSLDVNRTAGTIGRSYRPTVLEEAVIESHLDTVELLS